MNQSNLKICYFGIYDSNYSRNRILIGGLRKNGAEVIECNKRGEKFKYLKLFLAHWKIRNDYDIMVVGFPGQSVVWLAKLISRKPVVLDAFISFYDCMIFDRKLYSEKSLKAKIYYFLDWHSCCLADAILLDTEEHINYFVKTFHLPEKKFYRVYIGAEDEIFYPLPKKEGNKKFVVHFHGTFIPVQGVQYIIKAAKILEKEDDIVFNLIGKGQTFKEVKRLAEELDCKNINFLGKIDYQKLPEYISLGNVCLGSFGDTEKAKRVVANKVYECLAMAIPVINGDAPAMKVNLEDKKHCLYCRLGDEKDLAAKILELKNNPNLAGQIGNNGYQIFKKLFSTEVLGAELLKILNGIKAQDKH
ncbi:MAG: hypothetical protein Athens101410_717 [Parcubacteria group bacterium Athens1014_10]|nr:MAG: hypothetical protein Athens101410_717 [Parcubacteria group bacterium Athens1014_10]TSD04471.1 MAG: hypothetical protein Athens071412_762 [Parcubacteria group bacterium Athens0714_12]